MIEETTLHPLSVEELVTQDLKNNQKIHKYKNVWWREVKPFFYMPAWFLTPLKPKKERPNPLKSLGGYYHVVPKRLYSNGSICAILLENLSEYCLEKLQSPDTRRNIRRGLRNCHICPVPELEHLLTDGYEAYLSWKQRIGRVYKDRSDELIFRNWITNEYSLPKRLILGAYADGRLIAFFMAHAVEQTAYISMSFSQSKYHRLHPVEALYHSLILICKRSPGITTICSGLRSLRPSLNEFKKKFGFREVTYPAYIHMNYLVRPVAKVFLSAQYKRLMGQYED